MRFFTKGLCDFAGVIFFLWGGENLIFADLPIFPAIQSEYVYQGSPIQGLKSVQPHPSAIGGNWVEAMPDMVIAAGFMVDAGDFDFAWSIEEDGVFSITERYKGAFDLCKKAKGSIYKLSSKGFVAHKTVWEPEVVTNQEVVVLEEISISDVYEVWSHLEKEGKLKLYHFPHRPMSIPLDDSDIITKAVLWTRGSFPNAGKKFLQLHPQLQERFESALLSSETQE